MPEHWQEAGFGLYVHWPFCQAKCPYCDFNSHVVSAVDQRRWAAALTSEIRRIRAETGPRVLRSIFFGGGTPSLMEVGTVADVITSAAEAWSFANDIEITLEANPTSVEASRFEGYARAGVNRVSLGVQALRDADLRALGRLHDVREALAAVDIARERFERVSFDLIYGRQNQTLADWQEELQEALDRAPDHLSLYQLTIEDGTAFGDRFARGRLGGLPDEDLAADLYAATEEICAGAGLPAYEISNHARPGQESRHNLIYWQMGDYAGIGPGAHGRLTLDGRRWATSTPLAPGAWLAAAEAGSGEEPREVLSPDAIRAEALMMGMRLRDGIEQDRIAALSAGLQPLRTQRLEELGLIEWDGSRLRATAAGRPLLNAVLRELIPG